MLSFSNYLFLCLPYIVSDVHAPSSSPFSVLLCSNDQINSTVVTPLELLMQQQHELARKYYIETALKVRMFFQIPFPYLLLPNSAPLFSSFKSSTLTLQSLITYELACINAFTCITNLSPFKGSTWFIFKCEEIKSQSILYPFCSIQFIIQFLIEYNIHHIA